jgi:immune inhibitor A
MNLALALLFVISTLGSIGSISPSGRGAKSLDPAGARTGRIFWVLRGPNDFYRAVSARLLATTTHFCVWAEDSTVHLAQPMVRSVQRLEGALQTGILGAELQELERRGLSPFPLHVLFARIEGMGGYFSSVDLGRFGQHPYSNSLPLVYISTASCVPGQLCSVGLLAHELQHYLQYLLDQSEEDWLNEGLSELAEAQVQGQELAALALPALQCTDFPLFRWPIGGEGLSTHYRASAGFLAFWAQQFGEQALNRLAVSPQQGIKALRNSSSEGPCCQSDLGALYVHWVGELFSRSGHGAPSPQSGGGVCGTASYHELNPSRSLLDTVSQFGCDVIRLPPGQGSVAFVGAPSVPRVPVGAYEGDYLWWSGATSNSTHYLTRSFDLSRLASAHLSYWTWYELEDGYDYAYVLISSDKGESWQLLASPHMTASNPRGNSPGWGYTGRSGGWIHDELDLTTYVGGPAVVRFVLQTDDVAQGLGFFLDGLAIPELGYHQPDAAEDGWLAEGFSLVSARERLAQNYALLEVMPNARYQVLRAGQPPAGGWEIVLAPLAQPRDLLICALAAESLSRAPYLVRLQDWHGSCCS